MGHCKRGGSYNLSFRLAELHGWTDWCRSGGRLDLDHSLLVPFALAVLAGGLVGSRYGSALSTQRGVRAILVVVLILASTKRVLDNLL